MFSPIFYLFSLITLASAIGVIAFKNPVSSALCMVSSFLGIAGLFIGLNAYFIGILQILVYAGAIMVLFIFIIMLLDLKPEKQLKFSPTLISAAVAIPVLIIFQLIVILGQVTQHDIKINAETLAEAEKNELSLTANQNRKTYIMKGSKIRSSLKEGSLPDVHLIGNKLFTEYNFPLQIIGVLLLTATVGCVVLTKKSSTS